jgi:hypothetical protein
MPLSIAEDFESIRQGVERLEAERRGQAAGPPASQASPGEEADPEVQCFLEDRLGDDDDDFYSLGLACRQVRVLDENEDRTSFVDAFLEQLALEALSPRR